MHDALGWLKDKLRANSFSSYGLRFTNPILPWRFREGGAIQDDSGRMSKGYIAKAKKVFKRA
jgi:hypothetical protein